MLLLRHPRGQWGAGCPPPLAGSRLRLPLHFHFPGREEAEPDVQAGEQLGPPPPAGAPSLLPARRPARSGPTCLPCDSPAAGPLAGGSEGGLAGRRAAGLPGPGHGAPDLGAAPAWAASEGRRGGRGHQGAGRRGGRSGRSQRSVPAALRHAGTVQPRRAVLPAPAALGARRSSARPAFSTLPAPPPGPRAPPLPPPPSSAGGRDPGKCRPSALPPAARPLAAGRAPCTKRLPTT